MSGYPNAQLLTTPADLDRALKGDARPLVIDLRPPEDFAAVRPEVLANDIPAPPSK